MKQIATMSPLAPLSPWYLIAFLGAVCSIIAIWLVVRKGTKTGQAGFVIFICGAVLFIGLFLASLTDLAAMVLRLVLLICATFLPAMLYFLFIAARRESLFNAFTTSLERLGLLRRWWVAGPDEHAQGKTVLTLESPSSRRRRIKSYLDRFGALYGRLPSQFVNEFLACIERGCGKSSESNLVFDAQQDDATGRARQPSTIADSATFDFHTVIPVLGATCLLALGWIATLPPSLYSPYGGGDFPMWFKGIVAPTPHPVTFGFLGAYFYSLQMIVKRFVRRDLGANAYNAISLRIILAVIGIWVATRALQVLGAGFDETSSITLVASFAIGAFPLIVWQLITASLKKFPPFKVALPSLTSSQPLDAIDGISIWHQTRFEEEDVESVPNLASADIVDLMLSTKIPPNRMIDWIDQAILLTYLGKQENSRALLEKYGIRTATSLEAACRATVGVFGKTISELPLEGEDGRRFRVIVASMYYCPNFTLVRNWRGIADAHLSASDLIEGKTSTAPATGSGTTPRVPFALEQAQLQRSNSLSRVDGNENPTEPSSNVEAKGAQKKDKQGPAPAPLASVDAELTAGPKCRDEALVALTAGPKCRDEALVASFPPAILDHDSTTLNPAEFAQPLHKGGDPLAMR
jgi:hypothetical protein